jgi:hypothetical protein
MVRGYRYAGPDGEGIPGLPPGTGAAIGSEYCVHLLPGVGELEKAILLARDRRAPLLLLTPYFRHAELKKSMALFRAIPEGADVLVAVNDWGVLLALRALFPHGKREGVARGGFLFLPPREAIPAGGVRGGRIPRGCARVGKPRIRRPRGRGTGLLSLSSHSIVTVSDTCAWIGGVSSSSVPSCSRPCRNGSVALREGTMGREMIQQGKARFVETSPSSPSVPGDRPSAIFVLYGEVP